MGITNNSLVAVPSDLRKYEVYPKVSEMVDYIITNANELLKDGKYKYTNPSTISVEAIDEIIKEFGYSYISGVMGTLTNIEYDTLVYFLGMIALMKGHRTGLELVLKLLGIDSSIVEWWETDPVEEVYTFNIVVYINTSNSTNIYETLARVRDFIRHYVYPTVRRIDLIFGFLIGEMDGKIAGFYDTQHYGMISASV